METEFFDMYERQGCLAVEVGHNSIADWCITIYDISGKTLGEAREPTIEIQECDRSLAFAKAYAALAEHLSNTREGY